MDFDDNDDEQTEGWLVRNKIICTVAVLLIALVVGLYVMNSDADKDTKITAAGQAVELAQSIADSQKKTSETTGEQMEESNNEIKTDNKPINDANNDRRSAQSETSSKPNETTHNGQKLSESVRCEPLGKPLPVNNSRVYDVVEQMPSFPGGISGLRTYLNQNIRYPAEAQENCVQGRVVVSFVVEKDGHISDVTVLRSVDPSLDKEAIRVIRNMPRWTPGRQAGELVRVRYNVPVSFRFN